MGIWGWMGRVRGVRGDEGEEGGGGVWCLEWEGWVDMCCGLRTFLA